MATGKKTALYSAILDRYDRAPSELSRAIASAQISAMARDAAAGAVKTPSESASPAAQPQQTQEQSVDYSVLLKNAMGAGADSATVQDLLDKRVAKATADPSLNKYAFDDVYKQAMDYIDSARMSSSEISRQIERPQRQESRYEPDYISILERAKNYQPFSYDVNADPAYQAYAKAYRREGARATQNALASAAAMTGGVPSSYAVGAATQAGDYYASQLSDKIPELYQQAYDRYLKEYSRQLGLSDYYLKGMQLEEDRYGADVSRYNTDRNFAYGVYRDELSDERQAEATEYQRRMAEEDAEYQRQAAAQNAAYQQQQDQLDYAKYLQEYSDKQAQQQLKDALDVSDMLGYVPEQYAGILGVPAGTGTADAAYKAATLAKKSTTSGGGGSTKYTKAQADTALAAALTGDGSQQVRSIIEGYYALPFETVMSHYGAGSGEGFIMDADGNWMTEDETADYIADKYGRTLPGEVWQTLVSSGIQEQWLADRGFRQAEPGSLSFDEDEGTFEWNGKSYSDIGRLQKDMADTLTEMEKTTDRERLDDIKAELERKFDLMGFKVRFKS